MVRPPPRCTRTDTLVPYTARCRSYFVWGWTYAFLPLVKSKLRRRPVIITGTFNLRWGTGDYFHRPLLQRIALRIALRLASLNIFVSKHEYDPIREMGWTKRLEYSPHCVDTSSYEPSSAPREEALLRSEEHTSELQPLMRISY